jgi:hypothetical protein
MYCLFKVAAYLEQQMLVALLGETCAHIFSRKIKNKLSFSRTVISGFKNQK